ncbi:hypothetical protein TMatcc_007872 [Talaromyces marneffei ATCC 18224]
MRTAGCRPSSTGVCLPLLTIVFSRRGRLSEPLDCADRLRGGSFPMNEILRLSERKLVALSVDSELSLLPGRLRIGVEASGDAVVDDVILAKSGLAYGEHRTDLKVYRIAIAFCDALDFETQPRFTE